MIAMTTLLNVLKNSKLSKYFFISHQSLNHKIPFILVYKYFTSFEYELPSTKCHRLKIQYIQTLLKVIYNILSKAKNSISQN